MHLLYLDESPSPPTRAQIERGRGSKYFVIGGVIIEDHQWGKLRLAMKMVKQQMGYEGEIKWKYFGAKNKDKANPLADTPMELRDIYRRAIFSVLGPIEAKVIAGVADCEAMYESARISTPDQLYEICYSAILRTFDGHLKTLTEVTRKLETGIIFIDERYESGKQDRTLRARHKQIIDQLTAERHDIQNVVEGLNLQPSHSMLGLQLADMVCGAISTAFKRDSAEHFEMVHPYMLRNADTNNILGTGLLRWPKRHEHSFLPDEPSDQLVRLNRLLAKAKAEQSH